MSCNLHLDRETRVKGWWGSQDTSGSASLDLLVDDGELGGCAHLVF